MVAKLPRQLASLPFLAKLSIALLAFLLLLLSALLFIFLRPRHIKHSQAAPPPPLPPPPHGSMDPNTEVEFDFSPYVILYKSGRVERLSGNDRVPAGVDNATGVVSKDVVINNQTGLAARLYLPALADGTESKNGELPILVYYHGGAFVIESAFSPLYHDYLNSLVAAARVLAVSVEYRLAPEHRLPVAYDDSWEALSWVLQNAKSGPEPWLSGHGNVSRVFLAGDSAGGNIAHNMAMRAGLEGLPRFEGTALLDPYFWGKEPVGTETTDPAKRRELEVTWSFVCAGKYGIDDPLVNPMAMPAADWANLACKRVLVTVSELDRFRERGKAYVKAVETSGTWNGQVELYETEGEDHVYYLSNPKSTKAVKEMEFVVGFYDRL